ncbi:MAG: adaptor protein MecA [Lachnospiraceae bacterium]|nr:adaptor protein MecA [Lachnospiraceae bacterium]
MERINSNQIRIMLTNQDLQEWKLSIREMKYGSKDTTELFRQMIQKAVQQFSFNQDGLPLMIEAVPISQDSLLLIISAVEDAEELDPHFASFTPPSPALPGFSEEQNSPSYGGERGGHVPQAVVLSFPDIDSVMEFSWSISGEFPGHTALYRSSGAQDFYLVLEKPEFMEKDAFLHFMNGLQEYADIVPNSGMLYGYLKEHETPVMDEAVRKFGGY